MKNIALTLSLLLATSVHASETFAERVKHANDVEKTKDGQAYQDALWPSARAKIAELAYECVPQDPTLEGQEVTLVGTISGDGVPIGTEVQPATEIATCMADGFWKIRFPKPPASFSREGIPLVFVLHLKVVQ